jgi:hypothetical protein
VIFDAFVRKASPKAVELPRIRASCPGDYPTVYPNSWAPAGLIGEFATTAIIAT